MKQFLNFFIVISIDFVYGDVSGCCVGECGFVADLSFAFVSIIQICSYQKYLPSDISAYDIEDDIGKIIGILKLTK